MLLQSNLLLSIQSFSLSEPIFGDRDNEDIYTYIRFYFRQEYFNKFFISYFDAADAG